MLKWNGTGFCLAVPARDLNDKEVEQYGGKEYLLSLGIYEEPAENKIETPRPSKDRRDKLPEETK